jgi:thioredoxin reductase (NADPH)
VIEGGYDVAVVGGGPAGLASALAVGRLNRRAVVLEAGTPRTAHAPCYHNYLGFPEGLSGERLLELGHRHAERWGATFRETAVVEIAAGSDGGRQRFRLELADETTETAAGVILATGVKDCQPSCGPLYHETASGIHYCAICDGRETVGERTAVVGRDAHAVDMVGALRDFTVDLHLLLDDERDALTAEAEARLESWGVEIVPGSLERAELDGSTVRFRIRDRGQLEFDHVFLALGVVPRTRLADSLGCALDEEGYVRTDDQEGTTVPFVFAAGDCSGGLKQVTQAMAEGERAAIGLCKALREVDGPAFGGGPEAPEVLAPRDRAGV